LTKLVEVESAIMSPANFFRRRIGRRRRNIRLRKIQLSKQVSKSLELYHSDYAIRTLAALIYL